LILTGAAIRGASVGTTFLLLAYAAGAATSLAAALVVGGRLFAAMKRSIGAGEWIRRGLGVLVLCGVVAIAFGADTGFLTSLSVGSTTKLEQALIDRTSMGRKTQTVAVQGSDLPIEGSMPALAGATAWINSPPLTTEQLRGKVVLVDFWTYSCINCLRSLPYVRAWARKYKDHGLVVLGIHSPEFAFEKEEGNVRKAAKDLGITYPVAMDNDLKIWQAFNNEYWPAHYFIDAQGRIRGHQFGEGDYAHSEEIIQKLLAEAGFTHVPGGIVNPGGSGAEAAADLNDMQSPETYIGYAKAENFISLPAKDQAHLYTAPGPYGRNQWGLAGVWTIGDESAVLEKAPGKIIFRFHARDLHLVLGDTGKPVRFRVTLDGKAPGASHGTDADEAGNGTIDGQRLYQLIRQDGEVGDHTFEIDFLDPGVEAFSFTFG
jgi:thiol-disulfide isomerase/thioredoxin